MTLEPTTALLTNLYWITLLAVVVSSASAVLKAGLKQFDLFGVIIIAVATGLGGGSLRDMLLDRDVFWIKDQVFFIASLAGAPSAFLLQRAFLSFCRATFCSPTPPVWPPLASPGRWSR